MTTVVIVYIKCTTNIFDNKLLPCTHSSLVFTEFEYAVDAGMTKCDLPTYRDVSHLGKGQYLLY
jgi:hypothetical protein